MPATSVKLPALFRAAPAATAARASADWPFTAIALLVAGLGAAASGCTPKIGDGCFTSTDCSQRGDRLCDIAQPGGYCTLFNCRGNLCPDEASCVLFDPQIPGCGFDDRAGSTGSRVARSACMKACESDAECREDYVCADPRQPPWNAVILDDDQGKRSCLARPAGQSADAGASGSAANVCKSANPPVSAIDASTPAATDAGDAGADAGVRDGGDGG